MKTAALGGAVFCLAYYILIVCKAGFRASFAWIWPAFALLLMLTRLPFAGRWIGSAVLAGFIVLAGLLVYIAAGMRDTSKSDLTYVIIEGAQVKGRVPSRSLRMRLDRALSYIENNADTILILSGGQGDGEDISEADCMYAYLTAHGVEKERLILEDRSTSTWENLKFSDALTGCAAADTGIISNDFHIRRSLLLAKRCGYERVYGIPAKSDPVLWLHFMVREAAALAVMGVRQMGGFI